MHGELSWLLAVSQSIVLRYTYAYIGAQRVGGRVSVLTVLLLLTHYRRSTKWVVFFIARVYVHANHLYERPSLRACLSMGSRARSEGQNIARQGSDVVRSNLYIINKLATTSAPETGKSKS